jgi:hypothetical protein
MRRRIGHNDAMASHNPALNDKIFQREMTSNGTGAFTPGWGSPADELPPGVFDQRERHGCGHRTRRSRQTPGTDTMRMGGTMSATAILLGIVLVAAWFGWQAVDVQVLGLRPDGTEIVDISMPPWLFVSWIGGFVLAIVTVFKPKIARITGPLYAGDGPADGCHLRRVRDPVRRHRAAGRSVSPWPCSPSCWCSTAPEPSGSPTACAPPWS